MGHFEKNCISWKGPHTGKGEKSVSEEAAEKKCYRMTETFIALCHSGEKTEETGWGKKLGLVCFNY